MRFLCDENISISTIFFLRALGHNVKSVSEEKWFGRADEVLAKAARQERRILVTLDKDFGNVLVFPPKENQGIILVHIRFPKPSAVNALLDLFLKDKIEILMKRKLFVVEETQIRIRE